MKVLLVTLLVACATPPPPQTANTCPPPPEPSCRTAIEKAALVAKIRDREITMAVGECDRHDWPLAARQCVADAHTAADLPVCAKKFSLEQKGMFADKTNMERAMKKMSEYRDQMCACKDSACAQHVADDMTKWGQEEAKNDREPPKMSEEDTKAFTQIGEDMGRCMQKAMSPVTP